MMYEASKRPRATRFLICRTLITGSKQTGARRMMYEASKRPRATRFLICRTLITGSKQTGARVPPANASSERRRHPSTVCSSNNDGDVAPRLTRLRNVVVILPLFALPTTTAMSHPSVRSFVSPTMRRCLKIKRAVSVTRSERPLSKPYRRAALIGCRELPARGRADRGGNARSISMYSAN
ncbi:hypothetical protein QE152_g22694 [Popillia japonica]|uniref:Uncharacterized protein n=1 Tax=Popillia japonica TaxID=7064 RepID=A0AAW1KLB2_POPJA